MIRSIAAILLLGVAPSTISAQIVGDSVVPVNTPIVLRSKGPASAYIWRISRPAKRILVDGGKAIHVWAPAGKYDVELTVIRIDFDAKSVAYDEHLMSLTIGADPEPGPQPGPGPQPTTFEGQVKAAADKIGNAGKSKAGVVAMIYSDIAADAKTAPNAWDPANMVAEVKTRITSALEPNISPAWAQVWPLLASALKGLELPATDTAGHVKAFETIAKVFREVK